MFTSQRNEEDFELAHVVAIQTAGASGTLYHRVA
jgi:hypothetical protein